MRQRGLFAFMALLMCAPISLAQSDQSKPRLPTGLRIPATLKASLSSWDSGFALGGDVDLKNHGT
jgi:hypothetical protein